MGHNLTNPGPKTIHYGWFTTPVWDALAGRCVNVLELHEAKCHRIDHRRRHGQITLSRIVANTIWVKIDAAGIVELSNETDLGSDRIVTYLMGACLRGEFHPCGTPAAWDARTRTVTYNEE